MAKTKELTVEDKLRALYDLQLIDKRIDEIRNVRGELPLEVEDLEDEIAGLQTRVNNVNNEISDLEREIAERKIEMRESLEKITKYEEQQKNVRNNREFDAISKEIEFQQLEIQLAEKRSKEAEAKIANKKEVATGSEERLTERQNHLEFKRKELDGIFSEDEVLEIVKRCIRFYKENSKHGERFSQILSADDSLIVEASMLSEADRILDKSFSVITGRSCHELAP